MSMRAQSYLGSISCLVLNLNERLFGYARAYHPGRFRADKCTRVQPRDKEVEDGDRTKLCEALPAVSFGASLVPESAPDERRRQPCLPCCLFLSLRCPRLCYRLGLSTIIRHYYQPHVSQRQHAAPWMPSRFPGLRRPTTIGNGSVLAIYGQSTS
ncbi:hypothetical protein BJV78DRAFT_753293 [Lactifluus subvellereus]|nr:hypothetical protein BJV78DRAFT_753293 [Lactifluus subvellereus]